MSPAPQPQLKDKAAHEVPRATVASAVASLTKWMRERAAEAPPNLLADERDDLVVLQLSLRRVPPKPTTKPHLLPLPHPVVAHSAASVCVISDDRAGSGSPAATAILDAARSLKLPVSEVVPFSALRTDYRPYESRRRFAASYDLFLADRALLPMLPRLLGKAFYSTKKAPIAVDFTRAGWPEQVRKVLGSTFLYLRTGTCSGIKVGRLDMEEEEIVENVMAAVEAAVEKVPKKWANVRALHLKAVDSVALPIYQVVPELGMKIEFPVGRLEAGEVIDAAEVETGSKGKDKKMKALKNVDANGGAAGVKYKRKRKNKDQTEDVVMEEAQEVTEKRRKKEAAPSVEVSAGEDLKTPKKGKDKKRALDMEVEDASPAEKKGRKSEEASYKKSKGKKEGSKQVPEEVEDVGSKKNKGKKGEVKEGKKKKSMKGDSDDGEVLLDGESTPAAVKVDKEEKKSRGKKSSGDKMKRSRARV
ncbi:ribosomal L1 domain-containing protein 1-like isoform X3 [Hordeum vulgare subsp. vulgare]|uniref:ribosomal L1 domain-containing protein 1-like isoform X2 n=1 Tax=Hordeum vulgare subsp. vulgare TaxID=112509 RepID=UPI001D1A4361|nr:ribosomal L1 domain-containing protein 1-like isoform X2 [Hordeum vulgare subsp. vulgare]XP_044983223.1 ribosomal L1 domain-containing protein 1-like isoform X3 [Hordeum vulgare subsp. vulgare]